MVKNADYNCIICAQIVLFFAFQNIRSPCRSNFDVRGVPSALIVTSREPDQVSYISGVGSQNILVYHTGKSSTLPWKQGQKAENTFGPESSLSKVYLQKKVKI